MIGLFLHHLSRYANRSQLFILSCLFAVGAAGCMSPVANELTDLRSAGQAGQAGQAGRSTPISTARSNFPASRILNIPAQDMVLFNTDWLEQRWKEQSKRGGEQFHASLRRVRSEPSHIWHPTPPDMSFDDFEAVLCHVLRASSSPSIVYPTEQYYYFKFWIGQSLVSGNLRFTDVGDGVLHLGYFLVGNTQETRYRPFTETDGLRIFPEDNNTFRVRFNGIERSFILDTRPFSRPPIPPSGLPENVVHVSGILDESGYSLDLMFDEARNAFFYQLQPNDPIPEPLTLLDPDKVEGGIKASLRELLPMRLVIGRDSGFAFLMVSRDRRLVLVGVPKHHVQANNEFDGPFDQVPPRLAIRDKIHRAYPYTKIGRGIDEHGNFIEFSGSRVAISPYLQYDSILQLAQHLAENIDPDSCGTEAFINATFESKRHFHLRARNHPFDTISFPEHLDEISSTWPAHHWPSVSRDSQQ